jgi:hypothetical protein
LENGSEVGTVIFLDINEFMVDVMLGDESKIMRAEHAPNMRLIVQNELSDYPEMMEVVHQAINELAMNPVDTSFPEETADPPNPMHGTEEYIPRNNPIEESEHTEDQPA